MNRPSVLLDTSFFLRFLNDEDSLFQNADNYFRYFLQKEIIMVISTISIAEYCVAGDISELPLKNLRLISFNFDHSLQTGKFARIAFDKRKKGELFTQSRNIIPNDTKLFAQADCDINIQYYLSSDKESLKIYNLLKSESAMNFSFIDLNIPYNEYFGILKV